MRKKRLERLSYTLGGILRTRGMQGRLSEFRIFGQWEKTVGGLIAQHASPQSLRGERLYLAVDSPAWMQQLSLLKPMIIGKVNAALGKEAVKNITLNIGEVQPVRSPASRPVQVAGPSELTKEECARVEETVAGVRDPDVRQALRRLIEKDLLSKRRQERNPKPR